MWDRQCDEILCQAWYLQCFNGMLVLQATIGIDFLSKTMYLEDRTVSPVQFILLLIISISTVQELLEKPKACVCILRSSHHLFPFHHFTLCFFIILDFTIHFVLHFIMYFSSHCYFKFLFSFHPSARVMKCPPPTPTSDSHIHFVAGHRFGCSSGIQPDRNASAASSPVTSATQLLLWWFMT